MPNDDPYRAVAYPIPESFARIRFILVETQHPGNIGASLRAMKTAGFHDAVLVRPRGLPEAPEAWNLASGAREMLQNVRVVDDLAAATEDLHWLVGTTNRRRSQLLSQPIPLRQVAPQIASIASHSRVGILFGREDFGLSSADLARCNQAVAIPVAQGMPPLNLSHAVQVVAYELLLAAVSDENPAPPAFRPAPITEVEALLRRFDDLFQMLGPDALSRPREDVLVSLRRIFSRTGLETPDVRTLHMIVRSVLYHLQRKP